MGKLKATSITLSLVDHSIKVPRGVVEDVLVLDIESLRDDMNSIPIILRKPFIATTNALINCLNKLLQLSFGL